MISNRTGGLHSLLVLVQVVLALLLFVGLVAAFQQGGRLDGGRYTVYGGVVAAALLWESIQRDRQTVRTCIFEQGLVKLHRLALRQTFSVTIGLLLFGALLHDATLSRIFLAIYLCLLFPTLLLSNRYLPYWLARTFFQGRRQSTTLIMGTCRKHDPLAHWLRRKALLGFLTVGALCRPGEQPPKGVPVLGEPHDLERILRSQPISQVVLLGLPHLVDAYSFVSHTCDRYGVRLLILSDLDERLHHPIVHLEEDGLQFITCREEPLEDPVNRILKRTVDLVVCLPVIVLVLPWLCLLVAILHRLQSPGPLFYRQGRAGLHNREFDILKFRSMHINGDAARQATPGDERLFAAGRWLRRLSLDELPQFLNVLWGDMSVIGPRPHLLEHNLEFAKLLSKYHLRAFVRPGISGLAQVKGLRGEATPGAIAARLEADILYLENWSLLLDLGLILQTGWQLAVPPPTAV